MRRAAAAALLLLLPLPGWAAPKAKEDPAAAARKRLEAATAETLPKLVAEWKRTPEASVPLLIGALEAWEEAGQMPEPGLRALALANGSTPYARAFRALEEVTGLPLPAADFQNPEPDDAGDGSSLWSSWWRSASAKPKSDWAPSVVARLRSVIESQKKMGTFPSGAAIALSALRDPSAAELVRSGLASNQPLDRIKALHAAGLLGDRRLAPEVRAAFGETTVQTAAARAAGRLGDPALAAPLKELLSSPSSAVRGEALRALVRLGEVPEGLEKDLASATAASRSWALRALSGLPKDRALALLKAAAEGASDRAALDLAAARLLLGDAPARALLEQELRSPERDVRLLAARLLLQAGGEAGRTLVAKDLDRLTGLAIDAGVEALHKQAGSTYGYRGLKTYALLKCGVPVRDLESDLAVLAAGPGDEHSATYFLSVGLMALEVAGRPGDLAAVKAMATRLAALQKPSGAWGYGTEEAWAGDRSNTQFALLGLRAADLACAKAGDAQRVPAEVWKRSWDHFAAATKGGGKGYEAGWGYTDRAAPYGSMTCAGVCSLLICKAALTPPGKERAPKKEGGPDLERVPEAAAGIAWLDRHFAVARNPEHSAHVYYWLYSVERTGALAGVKELGGRDWYREGALWLLRQQQEEGGWGESGTAQLPDTAFALLFLRRATRPLYDVGEAEKPGK